MANCDSGKGIKVLSKDETEFLLNYLEGGERIAVMLGLCAGLRPSEVSRFRWEDVDFDKGTLQVYGKGRNKTHSIPLTGMLVAELRNYIGNCGRARLFNNQATEQYGKYFRGINKKLKALLSANVTFMVLRNTFAAYLVEAGVSVHTMAELLGYRSTTATLEKYLKKPQLLN